MGAIETKIFKSGNSLAVRLPKSLGLEVDEKVLVERKGSVVTIRQIESREEERAMVEELRAALAVIGKPSDGIQKRPEFEAPIRRGI